MFFRAWALDGARRRVLHSDPVDESVTAVAVDLGFFHLGRFAGHYEERFRESPSETLQSP